jgi:hypothetical protein
VVKPTGPLGLVSVDLPAGDYPVSIYFGETPMRAGADLVSLVTLVASLAVAAWFRVGRRGLAAYAGILILLAAMRIWGLGSGEAALRPTAFNANLQDEVRLVGYDAGRTDVHPGGTLDVRLFWLVQSTPFEDYKVFLHLIRPGNPAQVAQADSEPIGGYGPTTRWEPGELIADGHEFRLPKDLPVGDYQLLVGMYQESTMRNVIVREADQVLPGERIVLTTVRVTNE